VRTLWLTLELGGDLLSARQRKALTARFWMGLPRNNGHQFRRL
jgi:hypothetical protein